MALLLVFIVTLGSYSLSFVQCFLVLLNGVAFVLLLLFLFCFFSVITNLN